MKPKSSNPVSARANKLHNIGSMLVIKHLNLKVMGLDFELRDPEKKVVKIMVQNHLPDPDLGNCFTVDVDLEKAALNTLKVDRLIFVDYDDVKTIRIYECTDHESYTTKYIGGGREWRRIAMCFPIAKMTLLKEIEDIDTVIEMKKNSNARKFNLKSKNYSK
jgi:hypothetical protein